MPVQPDFLTPHILSTNTPGGLLLRAAAGLPEPARCVGDWLVRWAGERPTATFLAERAADGSWARVAYAEALAAVEALGSLLMALGGRPDRPVMNLSYNSRVGAPHWLAACAAAHPVLPHANREWGGAVDTHQHLFRRVLLEFFDAEDLRQ